MNLLIKTLAAVAACTVFATGAFAQSAVVPIDNEPAPRLIVEPPLPGPLAGGVVFIPYRVENLRILPVGGPAARNVGRAGTLHARDPRCVQAVAQGDVTSSGAHLWCVPSSRASAATTEILR